jgi:hypothetical protein
VALSVFILQGCIAAQVGSPAPDAPLPIEAADGEVLFRCISILVINIFPLSKKDAYQYHTCFTVDVAVASS